MKYLIPIVIFAISFLSCSTNNKSPMQTSFTIQEHDFEKILQIVNQKDSILFQEYTIKAIDNNKLYFKKEGYTLFTVGEHQRASSDSTRLELISLAKNRSTTNHKKYEQLWLKLVEHYQ